MTTSTDHIDQRIREALVQLDLAEFPKWSESKRSQALFRLIECLPVAAFGSRDMWNAINDRIIAAYQTEFRLEDEQSAAETTKALADAMRRQ